MGEAGESGVSPPALRQIWPECGHRQRQQEAGSGGQVNTSQSYVTSGTGDFSEVFPPLLMAKGYPFLPSVNPGLGLSFQMSLRLCLSHPPPCFPLLPLPSEAAQA